MASAIIEAVMLLKFELSLLRALLALVGAVPIRIRSAVGYALGFLFSFLPTRDRTIARLQLERFMPEHANWRTIAGIYAHVGQNVLESFNLEPLLANMDRFITPHNMEAGYEMQRAGKGIVCLTAHTGNWDLLAAYVIRKGYTLYTAGREAKNPLFHELLAGLRAKYDINMVWRADASAQRQFLSALRRNAVVAALIDQDTRVSGDMVPFFGAPAHTPTGLAELARRTGAGIVSALIVRTGLVRFEVFIEPIDPALSAAEIGAEFNRRLEAVIRRHPSQWVWFHKRWRTRETSTRLSSREYMAQLKEEIALHASSDHPGAAAGGLHEHHNP